MINMRSIMPTRQALGVCRVTSEGSSGDSQVHRQLQYSFGSTRDRDFSEEMSPGQRPFGEEELAR